MTTHCPTVTTDVLTVPGARLYHEVRGAGPLVVLMATPGDAGGFAPLADLLATDRRVLTFDPRGIHRSPVDDPDATPSMATRADDVARLVAHVGAPGPVTVFGNSGGASTVLALAELHPGLVDTAIAHEPPLQELLPDREALAAADEEVMALWLAGDHVGSMRAFLLTANIEMPEAEFQAIFGSEPDAQLKADGDYQNRHLMRVSTRHVPDAAALCAGPTRVVVGIGEESTGQVCDRASRVLAAELGVEPAMFPGGHIAFEDDPQAFLPALRAVLPR